MSAIALKRQGSAVSRIGQSYGKYSQSRVWTAIAGGAVAGSIVAYLYANNNTPNTPNGTNLGKKLLAANAGAVVNNAKIPEGKSFKEYQEVYNAIAEKVRDQDDADNGAGRYGLLTRLAWHASGTYDHKTNTGGSYGGTMIYSPESVDGENAGLEVGRDFLSEFKYTYPWLSRGDLWTLGGVVAVQECGGPKIPWRAGREDLFDRKRVPENGRLPDASKESADYVKGVFTRIGFNAQETVALIGAHCLGQCHVSRSGYDGPWGPSFNMFTNDFYVRLLQGWHIKKWDGKRQYEDDETNSFMMLPTDYVLKEDNDFVKYVKLYAEDQDLFFKDFSKAFSALLEKGVTYPKESKPWEFKTLDEQEEE